MDATAVLEKLGIADSAALFAADWNVAIADLPAGPIEFLRSDFVAQACAAAFLPPEMTDAVLQAAHQIQADDAASTYFWYCRNRLWCQPHCTAPVTKWPLVRSLGPQAGLLYVLVLLSATPQMQEIHRRRAIPVDVVRDTVLDLKRWLADDVCFKQLGCWGISGRILDWLSDHWRGELYHLGRLQFIHGGFRGRLRVFRHRKSGAVRALSEAGVRYRAEGQVDGAGGVTDPTGGWISELETGDDLFTGHLVDPTGFVHREKVSLNTADWQQALAPGDPVLDIHIPAGTPMDFDACGRSLKHALEFFPRHFPDKPFRAFVCLAWLMDHQLQELLPRASNLVRFQREMFLFPIALGNASTFNHVFGQGMTNVAQFPRRTSMQQALAQHVERGGHFRGGGGFLLIEDFDWGRRRYNLSP